MSRCFARITEAATPWVAALHGHVVAGGLELALACDVVVAADTTLVGDSHLLRSLLPAGGSSVRLPQALGPGLARRLLLTGQPMSVQELAATGWISRVVPADELDDATASVCAALAAVAGPSQSALKALLHRIDGLDPADALAAELDAFATNWSTQPVSAALEAFLSARTPTSGAQS